MSVALAACSPDDATAPPRAARAALTDALVDSAIVSPLPTEIGVDFLSNRFAYVWANSPTEVSYTPSGSYQYNANGGTVQIFRPSVGSYDVIFNSAGGWSGSTYGFALTAYGSSNLRCAIPSHNISGTQYIVRVRCFDNVTRVHADSRFSLLLVGSGSLQPRSAFAFGNQPSAPSYTPNSLASFTSGTGPMVISHDSLDGDYKVDLGVGNPAGSTFLVAEQFFFPGYLCKVREWKAASVGVRCFDADGLQHDTWYWALQVDGGRPGRRLGYAWANEPSTASYTPNLHYSYNSASGAITATRSAVGRYAIEFEGLQKLTGHSENVQVTPWGTGYATCKVVNWGNSATGTAFRANVECRNITGAFKDARFNVLVIE